MAIGKADKTGFPKEKAQRWLDKEERGKGSKLLIMGQIAVFSELWGVR